MNTIYRHTLTIGERNYTVHPVYKDDMALDFQYESQQMFYRANLSGKMDFIGEDASLIIGAPFTTEYILTIDSSVDYGLNWEVMHVCRFYQTDCTINLDDLKVTVKPDVKDRYNKVLDGMEKEYNLIELAPVIEPVRMAKRGIIQIYGMGDNNITNICGGMSWEQDFDLSDKGDEELWSHFLFARGYNRIEMTFNNPPAGLGGRFEGIRYNDGTFRLDNDEGVYYVIHFRLVRWVTHINRISDDETVWMAEGDDISEITFLNVNRPFQHIMASSIETWLYIRWLCDNPDAVVSGVSPQPLPNDDPMYGGNLRYALRYQTNTIIQSERTSTTPTQWGRKNEQEYFNTPDDDRFYIPVSRRQWVNYSLWYYDDTMDFNIEQQLRKYYNLKDAYPLWSVIQVLLDKLETGVTFEGTAEYSAFFYSDTNPLDDSLRAKPYITAKSNITVGEYSEPAHKAPVTLDIILTMLRKVYGCYWYIDEEMKMHIEHLSWFKNGGSYNGVHQIGIDLTHIEQPTNMKRWSFGTNSYQFDKEQMPARYQYKWMDECQEYFDGKTVEIESPFVQKDKVEEINVSNFSSDVDYMLVAPENVSKDGFALLMVEHDVTGNYLPIEYRGTAQHIISVQNLYASMTFLAPKFLVSDLPSWRYNWGDEKNFQSKGIIRGKSQKVNIPVGNTIPDLMKLIRTGLGDGQVDKMSINLASRMASTTLKYDTYAAE